MYVGTAATVVLPRNKNRTAGLLSNTGTEAAYIGFRTDVSLATGFGLPVNGFLSFDYDGPIYAISATGAAILSYWDQS